MNINIPTTEEKAIARNAVEALYAELKVDGDPAYAAGYLVGMLISIAADYSDVVETVIRHTEHARDLNETKLSEAV